MSLDSLQRVLCGVERMLRAQDATREFKPFPAELNCPSYSYCIEIGQSGQNTGISIMNTTTSKYYSFSFGVFHTNLSYFSKKMFRRTGATLPCEYMCTREGGETINEFIVYFTEFLDMRIPGKSVCSIEETRSGIKSSLRLNWSFEADTIVNDIHDLSGDIFCESFQQMPN